MTLSTPTTAALVATLADAVETNVYIVASDVECGAPCLPTSPGASLIRHAIEATVEAVSWDLSQLDRHEHDTYADALRFVVENIRADGTTELADGAVPIYTAERWGAFTDLAGWTVDVTEYGDVDGENLTDSVAGVALFAIAQRVVDLTLGTLDAHADALECEGHAGSCDMVAVRAAAGYVK